MFASTRRAEAARRPRADAASDPRTQQSKSIDAELSQLWDQFNAVTAPFGNDFDGESGFEEFVEKASDALDVVKQLGKQTDDLIERQNEIVEGLINDYPDEDTAIFTDGYSSISGEVNTIV